MSSTLTINSKAKNLQTDKKRISRSVSAWTPSSAHSNSNRGSRWTPRPSNFKQPRSISMEQINRNGGVILHKRGTDSHQDLILSALMACYVKNLMDTASISDKLNELGLKCMVIAGDVSFSFHDGKDSMKWSKWNCTKFGIYTIMTIRYRAPLEVGQTVKCLKRGSMNDNDRDLVESVLIERNNLGAMKVKDIARAIKEQGRACLVLRETNEYHYYKKDDMRMSWSEWICGDYGKYSIILMK
mmetsp:Transcript_15692/g.14088  ORF Transcript_15692/g.14088 Transcript_15692/m.14088 type:complete len:242 (+) Transcript_15692:93-818(+)